jgi:cytochrome b subunit of formate dehydrogenase
MNFRRWPRTDVGTVFLHWVVVIAIGVLLLTGLRFTSDDLHHLWLRDFDQQLWSIAIIPAVECGAGNAELGQRQAG